MSIECKINGVDVQLSEQDYQRIQYAEEKERLLQIERRKDRARAAVKAPEGKFAVYVWDPSNPEKSIPFLARTLTSERDAIYDSERYAGSYAKLRNEKWFDEIQEMKKEGKSVSGETDYFVVDDTGCRR